ncbi:serine hydrolase [Phenylobacterium sp.]|uniref:serine hydrolase domain-containing protein n=3 Tax=Phenylobacterium sp. TaxID=1871053 RepID=UPI002730C2A4|nr:serine hydrolase [Phenylobacterium sp.]MDP1601084.1 serine hydrolase [Phenylobacterium sp.]
MSEQGPGAGPWRKGQPEAHGLSSETLNRAAETLAVADERQGLVVIRNGVLVYERYWRNDYHLASPEWRNVSFSSGKSWGSTMVGLAYTKGLLGLDDLAARYRRPDMSGLRPETTIRHLLTMTSGGTLNVKPSSRPPRRLDDPRPPGPGVEYAWEKVGEKGSPPGYGVWLPAGQAFYYDGAAADHLADIVAAAAGVSSHRFMMEQIVSPLGCENFNYQPEGVDRNDNVRFGGSIVLSCRDMARLGQLYLNGGRWDGRQLIDADYIGQATSPSPANPSYGFLWWLNAAARVPNAPASMFFAAGARGQFCFVLPDQEMVIATMGFGAAQLSAEAAWDALAPAISQLPPSSP